MSSVGFVFVGYDTERVRRALPALAAVRRLVRSPWMVQVANGPETLEAPVFDRVIRGTNAEMEFSGYDEGLQELRRALPEVELAVFLNDTLCEHPEHLGHARAVLDIARQVAGQPALIGEEDVGRFSIAGAELFGEVVHGWVSTWLFGLTRPALDALGTIRSPAVSALDLGDRAAIEQFLAGLPPPLQQHLRTWLFGGGWKNSSALEEDNAGVFGPKLKSILHEFMLTARLRPRGRVIDLRAVQARHYLRQRQYRLRPPAG